VECSTDLAAGGAKQEGVQNHLAAKPVADASPVFEPERIGDRVGRDCAEVEDVDLRAGTGAESLGHRRADIHLDIAVEKMRILATYTSDIERIEPGLNGGRIGIVGARSFGVAARHHPVSADVAIDRRFVDRRQPVDPSNPSRKRARFRLIAWP
jgi:hypothetical protein